MARRKKNQNDEAQGGVNPISDDRIRQMAKDFEELKSETQGANGEMGSLMKKWEEDGGHKKALKVAVWLKNLGDNKATDFWRSLTRYLKVLGVFDQSDLLDPVPGQAAAGAPATAATH